MLDRPLHIVDGLVQASVLVPSIFIEQEPQMPFAARAAEGQRRVDLVLDLDQRVEHHRPAGRRVDLIGVEARVLAVIGVPAIDAEFAQVLPDRLRPGLAGLDLGVFGKREGDHVYLSLMSVKSVRSAVPLRLRLVNDCALNNLQSCLILPALAARLFAITIARGPNRLTSAAVRQYASSALSVEMPAMSIFSASIFST